MKRSSRLPFAASYSNRLSCTSSSQFICLQCRQGASFTFRPNPKPPSTSSTALRHASSVPFSEKLRRRIWGTDNPPGQKDPYSREEANELARRRQEDADREEGLNREEAQDTVAGRTEEDVPGDYHFVEETFGEPGERPIQKTYPVIPIEEDPVYKPAMSIEELEEVPKNTVWTSNYRGYMLRNPMTTEASISKAIELAIVEHFTIQGYRKGLRPNEGFQPLKYPFIPPTFRKFDLWQERENGKVKVKWKEGKAEKFLDWLLKQQEVPLMDEDMLHIAPDEQIAEDTEIENSLDDPMLVQEDTRAPETEQVQVEDAELISEAREENDVHNQSPHLEAETPSQAELPPQSIKQEDQRDYKGIRGSILFTKKKKFPIIKRVMQLTGRRIPDPTIQSIQTSKDLLNALLTKPPPKKLARILLNLEPNPTTLKKPSNKQPLPNLKDLPNVKVIAGKDVPRNKERDIGRQKVIERELDRRGLPVMWKENMDRIERYAEAKSQRKRKMILREVPALKVRRDGGYGAEL